MVVVFVIWGFISFLLALLGTVVGRNWSGAPNNPCRVKTIPCPIPEMKWYLTPSVVSIMGGLLPFGSIFIEIYFVFTLFWNYKEFMILPVGASSFSEAMKDINFRSLCIYLPCYFNYRITMVQRRYQENNSKIFISHLYLSIMWSPLRIHLIRN